MKDECPRCNGSGMTGGRGDFHDDGEVCTMISCSNCNGKGIVD